MVYYNPYYVFLFLWSLVWTLEVKNDKGLPLYPGRAHYAKIDSFSKIFWDLQKNVFKRSDFRSEIQHSAPVHGRRPYIFTLLPLSLAKWENAASVFHWMACTLCKNWAFQQNLLSPAKKKNKKMPSKGVICNRKSPLTPPQAKLLKYIFWPYV